MGDCEPAPLLGDDELLDFVDAVAAADPELLPPVGPQELLLDAADPLDAEPSGSPQSFATLPPWIVPDTVALRSCLNALGSDSESSDECGAGSTPLELQSKRESQRTDQLRTSAATCALPPRQPEKPQNNKESSASRDRSVERLRSRRRRKLKKDEMANLRERIQELEKDLSRLRRQDLSPSKNAMERASALSLAPTPHLLVPAAPGSIGVFESEEAPDEAHTVVAAAETKAPSQQQIVWKHIASHHKEELRKSRFKNVRLRAIAEQQLRVLKQLEIAFRQPTSSQSLGLLGRAPRRGIFDSEAAVFESLRVHLAAQYMETNRVYKTSGLASFDGDMVLAAVPRVVGGADAATRKVYLENMECKVFPFGIQAVNEAIWHCLTNSDASFHPGIYQVFEANEDIVTVKISDCVRLPQAETLVTVWLTVRRYEEDERIVTVWNAMVETEGSLNMRLHERGWNVLRPLLPATTRRSPSMCITQTVMRVSPITSARFDVKDVAMGTLANVLIGCYHRTVVVMHHVLEKLLLTEFKTLACET